MFLTKKKADRDKQLAVEAAIAGIPDLLPDVLALRDQLAALQADLAQLRADQLERETEVAHTVEARLLAERTRQDAGVQELLLQVHAVQGDVAGILAAPAPIPVVYEAPPQEQDPEVPALKRVALVQQEDIRQLNDTVGYLLEAPNAVTTIMQPVHGIRAVLDQHSMVRPMTGR